MRSVQEAVSRLYSHEDSYVRSLALSYTLRKGLLHRVLDHLDLAPGTRGADLGCGIGLTTLAAAARPGVRVTGIDRQTNFLETARALAADTGRDSRAEFRPGDILDPGFEKNSLDWVWSVDCMGYMPETGPRGIRSVHGILVPGGTIALMAWSSQMLLPGYPLLEARLNATARGLAPFKAEHSPDSHFFNTAKVLAREGFSQVRAATFVEDMTGPLTGERLAAIRDFLVMRWGERPEGLTREEALEYEHITGRETSIFNHPGWYGFFTYTLFTGVKS